MTIGAGHILHALAERHPTEKGWASFAELAVTTGHSQSQRFIDLYTMNTWPSNGRTCAYEVKVTRSDFDREIQDPSKRKPWESLAGECYFAVPAGLVKPDEVPEGWGLIVVGKKTRCLKKARQREIESWPAHFTRSLARRAADPPLALPLGSWTLPSGNVVTAAALRSLADRLNQRKNIGDVHRYNREARSLHRGTNELLGAIKRELERSFCRRFRSIEEVREALAARKITMPNEANQLRRIADSLDGGAAAVPVDRWMPK